MKKFVIIVVIVSQYFNICAQTSFNGEVLLSSLSKNTTIKINGEHKVIESTYLCDKSAEIEILSGRLFVLGTNGEEISIEAGKSFSVKKDRSSGKDVTFDRVLNYLNSPSTYLPNLYNSNRNYFGDENSELFVFPLESKVTDVKNIRLHFSKKLEPDVLFKVFLSKNDSLVWQTKDPSNKVNNQIIPLKSGNTYCWKIYNGSNSLKGKIELISKDAVKLPKLDSLSSKIDYLNCFVILMENECRFEAIDVLLKAKKSIPIAQYFLIYIVKFPV
ncbi:MAG: hypothetical protein HC831_03055 [Chloroflexia bacterium]|nr:hypothetical protein [Chloroflexia bacterium]